VRWQPRYCPTSRYRVQRRQRCRRQRPSPARRDEDATRRLPGEWRM